MRLGHGTGEAESPRRRGSMGSWRGQPPVGLAAGQRHRFRPHDPAAAELAIWYHDAIYDPAASDNEARSAALLRADMTGLAAPALLEWAETLVRLTATHDLPDGIPSALAADAALFLDLDMAVLGSSPAAYDAYERGIAAEYEPVYGRTRFAAGRATFLSGMLDRPQLFLSRQCQDRFDDAARGNMRRALQSLGRP